MEFFIENAVTALLIIGFLCLSAPLITTFGGKVLCEANGSA